MIVLEVFTNEVRSQYVRLAASCVFEYRAQVQLAGRTEIIPAAGTEIWHTASQVLFSDPELNGSSHVAASRFRQCCSSTFRSQIPYNPISLMGTNETVLLAVSMYKNTDRFVKMLQIRLFN